MVVIHLSFYHVLRFGGFLEIPTSVPQLPLVVDVEELADGLIFGGRIGSQFCHILDEFRFWLNLKVEVGLEIVLLDELQNILIHLCCLGSETFLFVFICVWLRMGHVLVSCILIIDDVERDSFVI